MKQWRKRREFPGLNCEDMEVPLKKKDEDNEVVQILSKINILLLKLYYLNIHLYIFFCLLSQI